LAAVITLLVMLIGCTVALYAVLRYLRAEASKAVGKEREVFDIESEKLNGIIDGAIAKLGEMRSLDELNALEEKKAAIHSEFEAEKEKVKKIESELASLQGKVDKQEARHNELKKGKEEADRVADEVRSNKERLIAEAARLEQELVQSNSQMTTLAGELNLDAGQEAAFAEIQATLSNIAAQLSDSHKIHDHTSSRFLSLQTQYSELEKEFRKLVDKELSGD
jgi:chromosome segregation ATPase